MTRGLLFGVGVCAGVVLAVVALWWALFGDPDEAYANKVRIEAED